MHQYLHHIGDYDASTSHLGWLEDAALTRLLRLFHRTERPIPAELSEACRLVRAKSKDERAAVESVLKEFFFLEEDGWRNRRAEEELAKYRGKSRKASDSAKRRWSQPKSSAKETAADSKSNANALRSHCDRSANHKPITNNHPPHPPETGAEGGGGEDWMILKDRLQKLGMRAFEQCATDAIKLRPIAGIHATLDHFEAHLRLPDGTIAFEQGLEYLYWRIASPACAEQDPAKGWKEITNPAFIEKKRRAEQESLRAEERRQATDGASSIPSALETEFGWRVNGLSWDEFLDHLPDGPPKTSATKQRRRGDDPPVHSALYRSSLLRAVAARAAQTGQAIASSEPNP